jgi:thymidylate synthase (FAD)
MKCDYIDHMGDDLRVVNAARVSFNKESDWMLSFENDHKFGEAVLSDKDIKLINYLASHGHWTPFSQPQITLRCTVPIFVARQDFKHQVGFTRNEVSRRYVDDTPEFFVPKVWRAKPEGSIKQGSGDAHPRQGTIIQAYENLLAHCARVYRGMVLDGVAPEQARMVLPQSMLTSYYVTGSLAAWARAYKQRIDPHAQVEIQVLAKQWGKIIQPLFPVSWSALTQ